MVNLSRQARSSNLFVTAILSPLLGLAVVGCGSSSAQPTPTKIPTPRATPPNPIHSGAIPLSSPIVPLKRLTPVNPPGKAPVRTLPTLKPVAIPMSTPIPPSAYTAIILGTVSDAKTHSPLAGAIISVGNSHHQVRSGAFGQYRLAFPGGPPIAVSVVMNGYIGALAMGRVRPHHSLKLDFNLYAKVAGQAPPPPSLFGTQTLPAPHKG